MRELSIVITVKNEEENIKPLLESIRLALNGIDYEIILVDDGSTDKTRQQVLNNADERTVLVELRKNYGQSTAMTAGIDYSTGDILHCSMETFKTILPTFPECLTC